MKQAKMKKEYISPTTQVVELLLKGSVLENVVVNTGSTTAADPGDSLSKKHNAFSDFEEDGNSDGYDFNVWDEL